MLSSRLLDAVKHRYHIKHLQQSPFPKSTTTCHHQCTKQLLVSRCYFFNIGDASVDLKMRK